MQKLILIFLWKIKTHAPLLPPRAATPRSPLATASTMQTFPSSCSPTLTWECCVFSSFAKQRPPVICFPIAMAWLYFPRSLFFHTPWTCTEKRNSFLDIFQCFPTTSTNCPYGAATHTLVYRHMQWMSLALSKWHG